MTWKNSNHGFYGTLLKLFFEWTHFAFTALSCIAFTASHSWAQKFTSKASVTCVCRQMSVEGVFVHVYSGRNLQKKLCFTTRLYIPKKSMMKHSLKYKDMETYSLQELEVLKGWRWIKKPDVIRWILSFQWSQNLARTFFVHYFDRWASVLSDAGNAERYDDPTQKTSAKIFLRDMKENNFQWIAYKHIFP